MSFVPLCVPFCYKLFHVEHYINLCLFYIIMIYLLLMVVYVDYMFDVHVVTTWTLIVILRTCASIYFLLYICVIRWWWLITGFVWCCLCLLLYTVPFRFAHFPLLTVLTPITFFGCVCLWMLTLFVELWICV